MRDISYLITAFVAFTAVVAGFRLAVTGRDKSPAAWVQHLSTAERVSSVDDMASGRQWSGR